MKALSLGLLALALLGCGEREEAESAASPPQAVAPVEVSAEEGAAAEGTSEEDPEALRARIAELEAELAAARGEAPTGTETAAIPEVVPEGVAVPGQEEPAAATPADTSARTASAGRTRADRRERRDPSLLDTVLGDDETRGRDRARDDGERTARRPRDLTEEVLELPGALLGE
ncbi:MAG: hypothetical protein RLP09_21610 [Sandaracinaceae bacterium]